MPFIYLVYGRKLLIVKPPQLTFRMTACTPAGSRIRYQHMASSACSLNLQSLRNWYLSMPG